VFDFRLRDNEATLQAAIRRSESQRPASPVKTVTEGVIYVAARATNAWGQVHALYIADSHKFLRNHVNERLWIAAARCVVAQYMAERTIEPAYARQAWTNARPIWTGPAEQDVDADVASALALLDLGNTGTTLDKSVFTGLATQLTALREVKALHFGKPPTLFTALLSLLVPERPGSAPVHALESLITHTAATDLPQANVAFGGDPEAQFATAQQVWSYATRVQETDLDAFGRLWAALVSRVRSVSPPPTASPDNRTPYSPVSSRAWTGAMCSRSGWASSPKRAVRSLPRGWPRCSAASTR